MTVVVRINPDGDVQLKGELITEWTAFNSTSVINDKRMIDGKQTFDTKDGVEILINYLFGFSSHKIPARHVRFDDKGNIHSTSFVGNVEFFDDGFDSKSNVNPKRILDTAHIFDASDKIEALISYLFGIDVKQIKNNKKKISIEKDSIKITGNFIEKALIE